MSDEEAKSKGGKYENPDSIPTAGGHKIGEEHQGESKMIPENGRSESVVESGHGDDMQRELEGKKPVAVQDESEQKPGMMEKAKDMMGMGKKE